MFEASDTLSNNSRLLDDQVARLAQLSTDNTTVSVREVEVKVIQTSNPIFNQMSIPSKTSDAALESLRVISGQRASSFTIISVSVPRQKTSIPEIPRTPGAFSNTIFELPNSSFISISVFNKENFSKLQGEVSYNIVQRNISRTLEKYFPHVPGSIWDEKIVLNDLEYTCQFYDINLARYNDFGCTLLHASSDGDVLCHCNHTTIYAVLLSVNTFVIPKGVKVRL